MKNIIILLTFIILAMLITWPLALHLNNFIIDRYDGLLIAWFLNWPTQFFRNGGIFHLQDLYNANIFYPFKNTFAFSETMLPEGFLIAPLVLLANEPLLAYNLNLVLGFILTGFSMFLLSLQITKNRSCAFFSAILFTFSTIHLNYIAHLQLFNFWPICFFILFILRKSYKLVILSFLVASLTTTLNFYFLLTVATLLFAFKVVDRRKIIIITIISVLITAPFLLPYYLVSRQFNYARPINDAIHFSLQFPDLLNISTMSRLSAIFPPTSPGTPAYVGAVFLLLVIFMINGLRKRLPKDKFLRFFLILALFSFILSLGPALHIFQNTVHVGPISAIPLPYTLLYYLFPGFSGFRTPSRWILLTAFSLAMAISIYFAKRFSWKKVLILSFLVLAEIKFPFQYARVPSVSEFPPEQIWLKDRYVGAPIVQFPIYGWFDSEKVGVETLREYYSTIHWHPMYNGYSGFSPKEWETRVKWLQKNFPNEESISYLRSINLKLVLAPSSWQVPLKLVASFPNTNIYELD